MHLTRVTGPIPDPFFEVVRRRHPDVDIVLLPPDDPSPAPVGPPVDDATVREELARAAALADELWRGVPESPEPAPEATLTLGPVQGTVQPRARTVRHHLDGHALLVRLKDELVDRGWRVDRIPGPVERLVAAGEQASVNASYAPDHGTFVFELTSPPLHVGPERARTLVEVH
jgi:hypothetical protein